MKVGRMVAASVSATALLALAISRAGSVEPAPRPAPPAGGGPVHPPAPPSALDPIRALAGEWERRTEDGKAELASVFAVSSSGHVVREIMFPGTEHEMTNMYHLDGDRLVVTHYCAIGNQPRMVAEPPDKPGVYAFRFKDCTNLKEGARYMGGLTLTIVDGDHVRQEWTSFEQGKAVGTVVFELTRRVRPAAPAGSR